MEFGGFSGSGRTPAIREPSPTRDLGEVSLNHALLARMSDGDWERARAQMRADLEDYYARV